MTRFGATAQASSSTRSGIAGPSTSTSVMCHPRRSPGSPRRPLPAGQADAVERQARSHRVAAGGHARATTRCRGRPSCAGPTRAWQENRGSSRLIESERVSAVPPELVAACRSASLGVLGLAGHLGGMIGGVSGGRSWAGRVWWAIRRSDGPGWRAVTPSALMIAAAPASMAIRGRLGHQSSPLSPSSFPLVSSLCFPG